MAATTARKRTPVKPAPKRTTTAHPLEHLIPDEKFAKYYVWREVNGIADLELIDVARENKENVLISGPTGSAKTSLVYAAAAGASTRVTHETVNGEKVPVNRIDRSRRRPVVYIPCNGAIDPSQLLGRWGPDGQGGYTFHPGYIPLAAMHGGIILLDEVNFMPPEIGAVMHGAMDGRRVITIMDAAGSDFPQHIELVDECQVIATLNPGYLGTAPLNAAFKNRFEHFVEFPYDEGVEAKLIMSPALRGLATSLREAAEIGDLNTPISTNKLLEFERNCANERLGFEYACENLLAYFDPEERAMVKQALEGVVDAIIDDLFEEVEVDEETEAEGWEDEDDEEEV